MRPSDVPGVDLSQLKAPAAIREETPRETKSQRINAAVKEIGSNKILKAYGSIIKGKFQKLGSKLAKGERKLSLMTKANLSNMKGVNTM